MIAAVWYECVARSSRPFVPGSLPADDHLLLTMPGSTQHVLITLGSLVTLILGLRLG